MRQAMTYGYGFSIVERVLADEHWRIIVRDSHDGTVVEKEDVYGAGADIRSGQRFQELKEKYLALY